jgi:hypothetical protein
LRAKANTVTVPSDTKIIEVVSCWGADDVSVIHGKGGELVVTFHRRDHRCGCIYKSICNYLLKHFPIDWHMVVLESPELNEMCHMARVHTPGNGHFNLVPTFVDGALLGII